MSITKAPTSPRPVPASDPITAGAAVSAAPTPQAASPAAGSVPLARPPVAPLESREDRLQRLMDLRQSRAESRSQAKDEHGRQVLGYEDAEGRRHRDVRFLDAEGRLVQSRTVIGAEGAVTEVSRTSRSGDHERWTFEDDFRDDSKDRATHALERYALRPDGTIDWSSKTLERHETTAADQVLQKQAELLEVKTRGVSSGLGGTAYTARFNSSTTLASGSGPDAEPVNVLLAQGSHGAGPYPGAHWDEASLVLLDEKYEKKLALSIDPTAEKTHLNVRFEKSVEAGQQVAVLVHEGYMQDEQGKRHFVESRFTLREQDVKLANPGLWGKIHDSTLGAAQAQMGKLWGLEENAKILTELPRKLSSVRVDGKEYKIDRSITSIDDNALFNNLPDTPLLATNYAPADSPLLSLLDPKEMEARRRFDSTFLVDKDGLLKKLPEAFRKGALKDHVLTNERGERRSATDEVRPDGPPLSSRDYTFHWDGKPIAVMTKELVRYRDEKGNVELGYRETIRPTPEYQAYLDTLLKRASPS
jgi:hypothetical protein